MFWEVFSYTEKASEGPVRIENLGTLGGTYLSPNTPSQIAIFMYGSPNVYDYTQISNILSNEFGIYWFGNRRGTAENGATIAVNPVMVYPGNIIGNVFPPSAMGGWGSANTNGGDSGGKVYPIKPVIFSGDKSSLPADKRSFKCLTEFIQSRGVADLAQSLFNSRATGDYNAPWQKVSMVGENGKTALRLDIPWSAFGTPLVSIRVPTELADTWIERPYVGDAQISAVWQKNNALYADLSGSSRIVCTVVNEGTTIAGTNLEISSGNDKLSVTPLQMTVNNLEPNVPQTVYFDAANLGVLDKVDNVPITIIAKDTYTGAETSRCTLYGTLLPTLNTGQTTLSVYAVEKGTSTPAANLQLQIIYGDKSIDKFTNANGATGALTLETPQGGAYVGSVVVQSADTTVYEASTLTYTINQAGIYETTLEVERKDTDYEPDFTGIDWLLIAFVVIIIVTVIAVGVGVAYLKRKKGNRRRSRKR